MANKKEQVIDAARELFNEYGYRKVSMDEIAKKSGVTKRTIYTYFKDKDDLIKYFLYEELGKMKEITEKIDQNDIPFEKKIHEIITASLDFKMNSKLLKAFTKEDNLCNLEVADECSKILNDVIQTEIKNKLAQAIREDYIKPCDLEITSFLIYKIYVALMFELDKPLDKNVATESIMNILKAWLLK